MCLVEWSVGWLVGMVVFLGHYVRWIGKGMDLGRAEDKYALPEISVPPGPETVQSQ